MTSLYNTVHIALIAGLACAAVLSAVTLAPADMAARGDTQAAFAILPD